MMQEQIQHLGMRLLDLVDEKNQLGAGETIEQIVAEHPRLTREAVLAAVEFAARALRADVVYPVSGHAE